MCQALFEKIFCIHIIYISGRFFKSRLPFKNSHYIYILYISGEFCPHDYPIKISDADSLIPKTLGNFWFTITLRQKNASKVVSDVHFIPKHMFTPNICSISYFIWTHEHLFIYSDTIKKEGKTPSYIQLFSTSFLNASACFNVWKYFPFPQ